MENTTLYKVFSTLSDKERRAFRKFVRSPYHNQQKSVVILFEQLEHAKGRADRLNKQYIFKQLYPGADYDYAKLRHQMSYLLQVLKSFLIHQEIEQAEIQRSLLLCRAFQKKGLEKLFEKEWNDSVQQQQRQSLRNGSYHYYNYMLRQEAHIAKHRKSRTAAANLDELSQELVIFFLSETLRMAATGLSHRTMSKQQQDIKLLQEAIVQFKAGGYESVPAVALYYYAYQALAQPDNETYFENLKLLIEKHWLQFPVEEIRDIYLLAINYSIYRMNRGSERFTQEGFELYKSGLQKGVLFENGYLSPYTYKNILIIALKRQEFEWAKEYLESYRPHLHPEHRENIYAYNLAHFYFRTQDYRSAMLLLQQVEFSDVLHNLDARRMLLRMYYELEEYDALHSLLESFVTYIRRKKIAYHRENYLNLIKFTKRLLMLAQYDQKATIVLREAIKEEPHLAEKKWLLKMLDAK